MILQVVAIKDNAAAAFQRPAFAQHIGTAMRSFADETNRADRDNPMYQHPEDFELYHLGTYDDDTGRFENLAFPVQLLTGKNAAIQKE